MKFSCENCGAKFQIADDKIGPRGAKVRCRRCDETIFLSPPSQEPSEDPSAAPSTIDSDGRADEALVAEPDADLATLSDGVDTESEVTPVQPAASELHATPGTDAEGARLASLDVGLGSLDIGGFGDEAADDESSDARPLATESGPDSARAAASSEPSTGAESALDPTPKPNGGVGSDALEGLMERNELLEMQASLQAELAHDLDLEGPEPQHDPGRVAVELGSAFEAMFGAEDMRSDPTPDPAAAGAPSSDHATNGASGEPAQWFVAIRDEQVGPLTRTELESRWNAAEISPATLSWRRGLESWVPIAQIGELSDLPRFEERLAEADPTSEDLSYEGFPNIARPTSPATSTEAEPGPSWRPSAAQALDSLADEELAEARTAAPAPSTSPFSAVPPASTPPPSPVTSAEPFGATEPMPSSAAPVFAAAAPAAPPPQRARPWLWVAPLVVLLVAGGAVAGYALWGGGAAGDRIGAYRPPEATPAGGSGAAATDPAATDDAGPAADAPPSAAAASAIGASADAGPVANEDATTGQLVEEAAEPDDDASDERKVQGAPERRAERPTRRPSRRARSRRSRPATPPSRSTEDDLLGSHGTGVPEKLSAEEVKRVLRNNAADVQRCVALQAKADPSIRGQLTVQMVLPGDGRPRRVTVVPAELREAPVGQCLIRSVKAWRFPRFSGSAVPVKFPVFVRGG